MKRVNRVAELLEMSKHGLAHAEQMERERIAEKLRIRELEKQYEREQIMEEAKVEYDKLKATYDQTLDELN
jgi:hypothetical protein